MSCSQLLKAQTGFSRSNIKPASGVEHGRKAGLRNRIAITVSALFLDCIKVNSYS
jgi:hypothetical protein